MDLRTGVLRPRRFLFGLLLWFLAAVAFGATMHGLVEHRPRRCEEGGSENPEDLR